MYEHSGLPKRFGTRVIGDLAKLPEILVSATVT